MSCGPGLRTFQDYFDGLYTTLFSKSLLVMPAEHSTSVLAPLAPNSVLLAKAVVPVAPLTSAQL